MYILQSLFGVSIVASYLVLVELGNSDGGTRMPMIAITISSSMRVKPDEFLWDKFFCITISYKKFLENDNFIGVEICVVNKVR